MDQHFTTDPTLRGYVVAARKLQALALRRAVISAVMGMVATLRPLSVVAAHGAGRTSRLVRFGISAYGKRRREQRAMAELRALDDRALSDIGLHRSEIPARVRGLWDGEGKAAVVQVAAGKANRERAALNPAQGCGAAARA